MTEQTPPADTEPDSEPSTVPADTAAPPPRDPCSCRAGARPRLRLQPPEPEAAPASHEALRSRGGTCAARGCTGSRGCAEPDAPSPRPRLHRSPPPRLHPAAPRLHPSRRRGCTRARAEAAPEPAPAAEAPAAAAEAASGPRPVPKPGPVPTPAAVRKVAHAQPAALTVAAPPGPPSETFGRVAEDGTVFVRTADGEREVGAYPGATPDEALHYFARKYDELYASADLLHQRLTTTDLSAKDAAEGLAKLREHCCRGQRRRRPRRPRRQGRRDRGPGRGAQGDRDRRTQRSPRRRGRRA